ncbi:MAG: hypothetical protein QOD07_3052 [Frankiaceae bacterium]|jgi:hypothetical protein|nr:hypothetical protein [Frankiaceae bacterium]
MFRRIAVVAVLVGAGIAVAPTGASATPLCETVTYNGVTTFTVGPDCIPYPGTTECSTGVIQLGILGTVPNDICLPH